MNTEQEHRRPTTEKLIEALTQAGAPQEMIEKARAGYYDEWKTSLAFPLIQLAQDAKRAGLGSDFHQRIVNGEFDAEKWESDAWAKSPEGQATFQEFIQQVEKRGNRAQRRQKRR